MAVIFSPSSTPTVAQSPALRLSPETPRVTISTDYVLYMKNSMQYTKEYLKISHELLVIYAMIALLILEFLGENQRYQNPYSEPVKL
jgi:hypothetical protein